MLPACGSTAGRDGGPAAIGCTGLARRRYEEPRVLRHGPRQLTSRPTPTSPGERHTPQPADHRPALLLAMGPGIAERLFADRHRDRLTALARTDPHLVAHDLAAPTPPVAAALADAEVLLTCWGAPPLTAESWPRPPGCARSSTRRARSSTTSPTPSGTAASRSPRPPRPTPCPSPSTRSPRSSSPASRPALGPALPRLRAHHDLRRNSTSAGNYRRTVGHRRRLPDRPPRDRAAAPLRPAGAALRPVRRRRRGRRTRRRSARRWTSCCAPQRHRHRARPAAAGHPPHDRRRAARADAGRRDPDQHRARLARRRGGAAAASCVAGRLRRRTRRHRPRTLPAGSPLYDLPNVLLTPHIAGSLGNELHRMADQALGRAGAVHGRAALRGPGASRGP